jgi:hypothetical protein
VSWNGFDSRDRQFEVQEISFGLADLFNKLL